MKEEIFFTSDTHFGHKNIIEYCSRPYPGGVEEMNEDLIKRWNEVVSRRSIIYHLGDFAFLGSTKYRELASRLNGRKILILGNHDIKFPKEVWEEINYQKILKIDGISLILNHFPFKSWSGGIQLHGHIHSKENLVSNQLDVGVDGHDYRPWSWEEIKGKIKEGF